MNLFANLYDIHAIAKNVAHVELDECDTQYKWNLSAVRLTLPVEVKGVKSVKAILTAAREESTGKGFICDIRYDASATIGETRAKAIEKTLFDLFSAYELDCDQPEGVYENYGTFRYDKRVWMVKRIDSREIVAVYTYQDDRSDPVTVCRFGSSLIREYKYSSDYIDENGNRYEIMRPIGEFEEQHGFMFSVKTYRNGYITYQDAIDKEKERITVHHESMLVPAPKLELGSVLYDRDEKKYAKLVEVDGERHLQYENSDYKGTWEPFVLSDRFVVTDTPFEEPAEGIYFDVKNQYFYKSVAKRPNYMVVKMADGGLYPARSWRDKPQNTGIVPLSDIELVQVHYDDCAFVGETYVKTLEGQMIFDILERARAATREQIPFWIGYTLEYYGNMLKACHALYFEFIGQMRHNSPNTEEITAFLKHLLLEPKDQEHLLTA